MLPFLREYGESPSSAYHFGHRLAQDVEKLAQVATLINADPREIVFTSCGTGSNIRDPQCPGHASGKATRPYHQREHSANIKFCDYCRKQGYALTAASVSDGSLTAPARPIYSPDTAMFR